MDHEKDHETNGRPASENQPLPIPQTSSRVLDYARRLLLGSVSMTLDEINDFLGWITRRGGVSEAEVARLVQEYVETRSAEDSASQGNASHLPARTEKPSALERSVETILVRLNVPTRSDIENLSRKITHLNDKVTRLKELREAAATPVSSSDDLYAPLEDRSSNGVQG